MSVSPAIPPINAADFPEGQAEWISTLHESVGRALLDLDRDQRGMLRRVWEYMANHTTPPPLKLFSQIPQALALLVELSAAHLLLYDGQLRSVLQAPPFSAIQTPHQIKAFGWERVYITSPLDAPLALLIYGPNVWMEMRTVCPQTGASLVYRLMMQEDGGLVPEQPGDAVSWRLWIPLPQQSLEEPAYVFNRRRSQIRFFQTEADLERFRMRQGSSEGMVFTCQQALAFSRQILALYALLWRTN